jgi:CDP-diacylglycerol--serine O-phosphatidyltransferase
MSPDGPPDGPHDPRDADPGREDRGDGPGRALFGRRFGGAGRARRLKINTLSFNRIFPNILTLLALCAGLTAIRYAMAGKFEQAVTSQIIAAMLDGIDGRVARLLRATSKFGQELDSLADGISFGVCPAIVIYLWTMNTASSIGWALCLLYAVCCVLRLARFNTMVGQPDLPPWAHNYFTGVPAPAGAGLAILPMILWLYSDSDAFRSPVLVGLVLIGSATLMVSRVPTFSGKHIRLKPQWVLPLMILIGLTAAFLVTDPWATLSVVGFVYLASIPFAVVTFRKLQRAPAHATEPTTEG